MTEFSMIEVICLAIILIVVRAAMRRRAAAAAEACALPLVSKASTHASKSLDNPDHAIACGLDKAVWVNFRALGRRQSEHLVIIHEISGVRTAQGFEARSFEAYSRKAAASRTFLVARVAQASDAETGQRIMDFPRWLATLANVNRHADAGTSRLP